VNEAPSRGIFYSVLLATEEALSGFESERLFRGKINGIDSPLGDNLPDRTILMLRTNLFRKADSCKDPILSI
jgi:hypothetical protein